jgi:hypothetical protein
LPDIKGSEQIKGMTEAEARTIMKAHGWGYRDRKRRNLGTKYIYAQRRQGSKRIERYICPFSKLGDLTELELLRKLAPEAHSTQ